MHALQTEIETYHARLADNLPQHEGDYVVILGTEVAHFSSSYDAALDWGYDQYGTDQPFLVKKIAADEDVAHFTRDLGPCRT